MDNYFFTNLAILVIFLTALTPISFFFFFNHKFSKKERKEVKLNLDSLDDL